jgi:hypothetical protein
MSSRQRNEYVYVDWPCGIAYFFSPAIAYVLFGLLIAVWRSLCPVCGKRALKMEGLVRAAILLNGKRAPDHWSYYVCQHAALDSNGITVS